jgi:hypothetical protein
MEVAANESTPPELLTLMTLDPSGEVRGEVEENPNCPPAALQFLADLESARDPETPKEDLVRWSQAPEGVLRYHVARNPGIDDSLLESLTQQLDVEGLSGPIAWGLAENPSTPAGVLLRLTESDAFDSTYGLSIAWAVALHPNSSAEVLAKLTNRQLPGVQEAVALHPNSSAEVLAKLSDCDLLGVQEALASRFGR